MTTTRRAMHLVSARCIMVLVRRIEPVVLMVGEA